MENSEQYSADTIDVLEGVEAIRRHPGMYVHGENKTGLHHCLWEIINNSVDEAMAGYCNQIDVSINADGYVTVKDNGRGIPVSKHPVKGISTATLVVTQIHAGGKFNNASGKSAYKTSGGLHGVGATAVNALADVFIMDIWRDGGHYQQEFRKGVPVKDIEKIGESEQHGTQISYHPDPTIFIVSDENDPEENPIFDDQTIEIYLSSIAHINPGLRISYKNEQSGLNKEWYAENYTSILKTISPSKSQTILGDTEIKNTYASDKGDVEVVVVMRQHVDRKDGVIRCYTNNIYNPQGGTHLKGFRAGLSKAVKFIGEEKKVFKPNDDVQIDDILEGFAAAVIVRIGNPSFHGQTKDKLLNNECAPAVSTVVYEYLNKLFEENPSLAKAVAERAYLAYKARINAEASRQTVERKGVLSLGGLPGKLADCQSEAAEDCELYIVEGDSAGGSAKLGRDRKYQAILPLKGKPLNVQRLEDIAKGLNSEEIRNIVQVLGCGASKDFDLSKLRYHKIILMTDADVDGSHITTLLLTLMHKYMPELLSNGHVYVAMPPLYRLAKGKGKPFYINNDVELNEFLQSNGGKGNWDIQRFKGLGEMNPEQLWETTMNPETRTLKQISYEESHNDTFELLMGEEVAPRRQFIETMASRISEK